MTEAARINEQITTHFGGEHQPEVFKKLASNKALLHATWKQYQRVMSDGEIDLQTKELIGLCVAIAKPNEYVIGLQHRRMRRVGVDASAEHEALAVAGFFEGLDSFAHALHVDSDLRPRRLAAGDMSLIDQEIDVNVPYVVESDDPIVKQVYDEIQTIMRIPFVLKAYSKLS